MEPNGEVSAYAPIAMKALMTRIEDLSTQQFQQRQIGDPADPVLDDDLELAKFMAGLVLDYLHRHDALDLVFEVG